MNWLSRPVNIVIVVFAALAGVLALVGVIYGVKTHKEAGLLQVCWNEKSAAEYVVPFEGAALGDCDDPEEIEWSKKQIPLKVAISDLRDDGNGSEVKAAIIDINNQLGFKLFTAMKQDSSVNMYVGAPVTGTKRLGTARHYKTPNGLYAQGHVYSNTGSSRLTFLVAHHELLHIAGLAHDDFPDSAIYSFDHDDSLQSTTPARITDFDKALLREKYLPAVR